MEGETALADRAAAELAAAVEVVDDAHERPSGPGASRARAAGAGERRLPARLARNRCFADTRQAACCTRNLRFRLLPRPPRLEPSWLRHKLRPPVLSTHVSPTNCLDASAKPIPRATLTACAACSRLTLAARRGGSNAILADYSRLFKNSEQRSLGVRDVSWFTNDGTLTIIASYEASIASGRNRRARRTHGDLRMDLRLVDEQWRIYRLQHDERGG